MNIHCGHAYAHQHQPTLSVISTKIRPEILKLGLLMRLFFLRTWINGLRPRKLLCSCDGAISSSTGSLPMPTFPECHVSHNCRPMIRVGKR